MTDHDHDHDLGEPHQIVEETGGPGRSWRQIADALTEELRQSVGQSIAGHVHTDAPPEAEVAEREEVRDSGMTGSELEDLFRRAAENFAARNAEEEREMNEEDDFYDDDREDEEDEEREDEEPEFFPAPEGVQVVDLNDAPAAGTITVSDTDDEDERDILWGGEIEASEETVHELATWRYLLEAHGCIDPLGQLGWMSARSVRILTDALLTEARNSSPEEGPRFILHADYTQHNPIFIGRLDDVDVWTDRYYESVWEIDADRVHARQSYSYTAPTPAARMMRRFACRRGIERTAEAE